MPQAEQRRRGRHRLHPPGPEVTRRRVGDPNPRGSLKRPTGRFALAPDLTGPGEITWADALARIEADWDAQVADGRVSATVIRDYKREAQRLRRRSETLGRPLLRETDPTFIFESLRVRHASAPGQPVTDNTRRMRLAAARAVFLTAQRLGLYDQNPAKSVEEVRRQGRYVHAFTADQIEHLKRTARYHLGETKTPAALALALLGASSGENTAVRIRDVDLEQRRVWLHDGGYRSRPRWVPIDDDWCLTALRTRIQALTDTVDPDALPDMPVTYSWRGGSRSPESRAAATGQVLLTLLRKARLHEPGVTRAESIREHLAHRVFTETGRVEAVAIRLGLASLDAAAHLVGYDWVAEHAVDVNGTPAP